MILRDFIQRANQALTQTELLACFEQAVLLLGYQHFSLCYVQLRQDGSGTSQPPIGVLSHNYPSRWVSHYIARNYYLEDPVRRHAPQAMSPYRWKDVSAQGDREAHIMDEATDAGLADGLGLPIHEPGGRIFLATVASHQQLTLGNDACVRAYALVTAFHALYTMRFATEQTQIPTAVKLTSREAECLTWVAYGKSSWEIGRIMRISEHTVNFHLKNAMAKFDTASRVTAAVRAANLGLISIP
ncbi:LuxR family transcriptional regulator [Paracidovorax citrulli]|nr:LuxR family transcriptional regulator [Paracidovorax citrulli]UMT89490.1 LuxR family transcriptional regulator [Paracidovorax citrulli]WIY35747.1 LuxR family transcriptional regulator [Paracidovorax citrulli]SDJ49389.1 transcriptional regulator, LuxR family [Paracidovorax citrulli]